MKWKLYAKDGRTARQYIREEGKAPLTNGLIMKIKPTDKFTFLMNEKGWFFIQYGFKDFYGPFMVGLDTSVFEVRPSLTICESNNNETY